MTRRKREINGLANELDFPHLVELVLPPGGFRSVFLEIDIRFCFPDTATADAFRDRFGGESALRESVQSLNATPPAVVGDRHRRNGKEPYGNMTVRR